MVNDIQLAHPMVLYQRCYLRFSWFSGIAYQKYVSVIDLRILEDPTLLHFHPTVTSVTTNRGFDRSFQGSGIGQWLLLSRFDRIQ